MLGFVIGTLASMIGGGGGALFVVVLAMLFHLPERMAAATSLVVVIPTTIFGAIGHFRGGHVDVRRGLPLLVAGPIGAVLGSIAIGFVNDALATRLLCIFLLLLGVQMAYALVRPRTRVVAPHRERALGVAYGMLGGITSGAFGISGSPPIIAGLGALGLDPVRVIGTSVFALTGIAIAGGITHAFAGDVRYDLALALAAGSALGAYLGARLLARFNGPRLHAILRPTLVGLVALAGLLELVKLR